MQAVQPLATPQQEDDNTLERHLEVVSSLDKILDVVKKHRQETAEGFQQVIQKLDTLQPETAEVFKQMQAQIQLLEKQNQELMRHAKRVPEDHLIEVFTSLMLTLPSPCGRVAASDAVCSAHDAAKAATLTLVLPFNIWHARVRY